MAEVKSFVSMGSGIKGAMDTKTGLLSLVIDTKAAGKPSASGKSKVIASTGKQVAIAAGDRVIYLSANVFEYNPR